MVRIRLTRIGTKKKPFYRLIAADQRSPRDGKFIEQLGWYDPLKNPHQVKFDLSRIDYWLSVGAQPTDTAEKLIKKARTEATVEAS
ncbi:MAG: 30S ribosomal protein S16 [Myxococcota bacterium]